MAACRDIGYVLDKLAWMRAEGIWPNGLRYLWTDAFGVVLLMSLHAELQDPQYLELTRDVHDAFVVPAHGVRWKMREDLSGPDPDFAGFGALDAFDGYVAYRLLDEAALAPQVADMRQLVERSYPDLLINQDLGIGMMLWMTQFFPHENWAVTQRNRCLGMLDRLWTDEGYFCRGPGLPEVKFAFTNYGVAIGLQAVGAMSERVDRLHSFFERYRSGDEYDREAITHVMACGSHLPGYLLQGYA